MPDHLPLLRKIAEGDRQAFHQLYGSFSSKVFNTALGYLHNTEEAEEITQDVFVEVYQSAKGFKGDSSIGTWIYRITVNKSLDRLRYRKRKKRFAFLESLFKKDSSELQHDIPSFEHPGIELENKENAAILFQAIELLSEQQKTAFILSYIEDLSQKEVAEIMKLSEKAVESLLQRAKANLRRELENLYPNRRKK